MLFGIKLGFLSFSFILYSRKVAWCSGSISRPRLYKSQQLVFLWPVGFRNLPCYVHFILIICFCLYLWVTMKTIGLPVIVLPLRSQFVYLFISLFL